MAMSVFGVSTVRSKFSMPVEQASRGQTIGIMRRGQLVAMLTPATRPKDIKEIFRDIERIRKRAKLPRGLNVKDLIAEGRI